MPFINEEALQPRSIAAATTESVASRWLVMAAGKNPFFNVAAYAESLQESLVKRHHRDIRVEACGIMADSITSIRKLIRLIPRFDSIQLFFDGTVSFAKSVFPAVVMARFFGKSVALFYYPDPAADEIPPTYRKTMSLCSQVYVGTKYLQRELAQYKVKSEVLPPPVNFDSWPVRVIDEVQPHLLLVHNSAIDSGAICAIRAFIMVKHKYPRTTITVVTQDSIRWMMGVMQLGQNIQGHDYVNPDNEPEFRRAFSQADIFVNCSQSESVPPALLAAMASGLPSISFESYGAREIIEYGMNGLLIRHNDHNQLANEIIRLIEEPALAAQISREAAKIRRKLSVDNIARLVK